MTALRSALHSGSVNHALAAIPIHAFNDYFSDRLPEDLFKIFMKAALLIAGPQKHAIDKKKPNFIFDADDPEAATWADRHAAELVVELSKTTQAALEQAIRRAINEKEIVDVAAKEIRSIVGLTDRMEDAVEHYRESLLEDGLAEDLIEEKAERYAGKLLSWRAENIARSESMRASNEGQREVWRQSSQDGVLDSAEYERQWDTFDPCPECEEYEGETAPLDGEYHDGVDGPPLHPSCKCSESLVRIESSGGE